MDFNLEYYRAFFYVAKFASITKAAEALYLTQPAISRTIKKLEEHTCCRLFQRTPSGMALTREGEVLYNHVCSAFNELEIGEQKVHKYVGYETGELFIGSTETALYHYVMPRLTQFQKRFPKIRIHVRGCSTSELWQALNTASIDIAILVSPLPKNTNCRLLKLIDFQDALIAGYGFSELKDRTVSLDEIVQYPLVCLETGTAARTHLDEWFLAHDISLNPDYSVQTSTLVLPFVENNLALGIIPHVFLERYQKDETLFRIKLSEEIEPRQIYLAINNEYPMSSICHEFVRILSEDIGKVYSRS